ncbi:uncharacterized protein B0H64DRAFT_427704 [Chaetomium fimeti]|uniref:Uncharacterized protein n=1 Tax=Chaetomium fimeti TaxID=1854472 RepID=A0AAE0H5N1_9PEZI|nr:hypothetical protein B0H64DRAFT_427704 [Chaetomium fimeti]
MLLGRPGSGSGDDLCNQSNWITTGSTIAKSTAYSACPEGMTGVSSDTTTYNDITVENTVCCPTAYDFFNADYKPTTLPTVVDGTTYPVTYQTSNAYCKATSIKQFSGQKVTATVVASPTPTTTEVEWDYEHGYLLAPAAARIQKYIYTNGHGTIASCFGSTHCSVNTNPIEPRPTYAPYGTYVPPPVTSVARFTPAASCLAESNLWLVSDRCSLTTAPREPPWLQCTHTVAGDPDPGRADCYPGASTVISGTPTYYTGCPAGYTTVSTTRSFPWTTAGEPASAEARRVTCCPSALHGDMTFTHTSPGWRSTTVHDGTTHTVSSRRTPPYCVARAAVPQADDDRTVTLGLYWNGPDEGRGRTYDGSSEVVWQAGADLTVYAHPVTVRSTVFHGTHTCFDAAECRRYFTYSISNTMGSGVVVATPTPTGGGGGEGEAASSSSTGGAVAAVARGDGRVGLVSVVVVVTVIVNVALGGLV